MTPETKNEMWIVDDESDPRIASSYKDALRAAVAVYNDFLNEYGNEDMSAEDILSDINSLVTNHYIEGVVYLCPAKVISFDGGHGLN